MGGGPKVCSALREEALVIRCGKMEVDADALQPHSFDLVAHPRTHLREGVGGYGIDVLCTQGGRDGVVGCGVAVISAVCVASGKK